MTPNQAIDCGNAFALAHLRVIEAAYGVEIASAYAAGHAWAARDYVLRTCGDREAYKMCQDLADNTGLVLLTGAA